MSGRGVHVVTVNDYLAKRDPQWMGPIFHGLGPDRRHHPARQSRSSSTPTTGHRRALHLPAPGRRARRPTRPTSPTAPTTSSASTTCATTWSPSSTERVQRERYFAIVDEVDNILIDEARTPLIISGQAEESDDLYYQFARLVPRLAGAARGRRGGRRLLRRPQGARRLADRGGHREDREAARVDNLYAADPRLARHFEQALRAHALYQRDRDYIVKDGEIVIVDEFTGRQMPGRRWSEGLHQAVEAKEGLRVQRESVTLATITFQNYFRLYDKLAGMTGTAMTEQEEFYKIYGLEVVAIPTHRPMVRDDDADLVYRDEKAKFKALIDEIVEMREAGRPVLVGTTSVEKSEVLCARCSSGAASSTRC